MSTSPLQSRPAERAWTIGELARQLRLTARTLRYWEQLSLLPPANRSPGGFRTYGEEHARAARGVALLKEIGCRLDEIQATQAVLGASATALQGFADVGQALERLERRLARRIERAQELLSEVRAARSSLGLCTGCDGKVYDDACIDCLSKATCNRLPDALVSVMSAAAEIRKGAGTS